jgi:hypothetical protein
MQPTVLHGLISTPNGLSLAYLRLPTVKIRIGREHGGRSAQTLKRGYTLRFCIVWFYPFEHTYVFYRVSARARRYRLACRDGMQSLPAAPGWQDSVCVDGSWTNVALQCRSEWFHIEGCLSPTRFRYLFILFFGTGRCNPYPNNYNQTNAKLPKNQVRPIMQEVHNSIHPCKE